MIRLFRSIQPILIGVLLLYLFLLNTINILFPLEPNLNHSLFTQFEYLKSILKKLPKWTGVIIGLLLMAWQAIRLNKETNGIKLFEESNFLPALALIMVYSMFKEWSALSNIFLVNMCLLYVLIRVIKMYGREVELLHCFDVGLYLGVATLFFCTRYMVFSGNANGY